MTIATLRLRLRRWGSSSHVKFRWFGGSGKGPEVRQLAAQFSLKLHNRAGEVLALRPRRHIQRVGEEARR